MSMDKIYFFDRKRPIGLFPLSMNSADDIILKAGGISRNLPTGTTLLEDVSLELASGERLVVVGPSGAGKTTLLRLLQRLDEPTEGTLSFRGKPYETIPPTLLRRRIAFVFQEPALFDGTVEDNLRIHERLGYQNPPFTGEDLTKVMKSVGLAPDFPGRDTQNLSTGEVKRVAVARALLGKPEILLLDEPTANLDPTAASSLLKTLKALSESGLAMLAVMHQVKHARELASRILLLVKGRVVETATADRFFSSPVEEISRRFLKGELE